jgi:hypothetical protein
VGSPHINRKRPRCASPRRPRPRICLRKGCGRKYQPRRWNQRYCQDAECLRQVRRWQAAKRQARRRQDEAVKAQHAQAQRARRQRTASSPQPPQPAKVAAARGHAAKTFFPFFCAAGRGAMNLPRSRLASRRASAAWPVARRFAGCWIANTSGNFAALSRAAADVPGSTSLPARATDNNTTPPAPRQRGRPPHDRSPRLRRSAVCCLASHAA